MGLSLQPEPTLLRKGDLLYREGDPTKQIYILQSGLISLSSNEQSQILEVSQATPPQLIGEEALWGSSHWTHTATAVNDSKVFSIPLSQAQPLLDHTPPLIKLLTKSFLSKHRNNLLELGEFKREALTLACPPQNVTRLFAVLYFVSSYTGTLKNDWTVVVWNSFKKYAQRVFLESPVRIENAVYLLVKLGHAKLEMVKSETDPEAPEELGFVHFKNPELFNEFYKFHRTHYFKGTLEQALNSDSSHPQIAEFRRIIDEISRWNHEGKVLLEEEAA